MKLHLVADWIAYGTGMVPERSRAIMMHLSAKMRVLHSDSAALRPVLAGGGLDKTEFNAEINACQFVSAERTVQLNFGGKQVEDVRPDTFDRMELVCTAAIHLDHCTTQSRALHCGPNCCAAAF